MQTDAMPTSSSRPCRIVALVGRPNVGKSTLFNRLTKSNKAIVDPTPGVTRDRHYERVILNEQPVILIDTGGIEMDARDPIGTQMREQTWQAIEEADAILFLLDGREGVTTVDHEVAAILRRSAKPVYALVNKIDGPEIEQELVPAFFELGLEELWPVSAAHGYGLRTFTDRLVETLAAMPSAAAAPLPTDTIGLAVIGRPNVGKSSLINRLVGEERMVVSDIPGTTRDSVDTLLERRGRHYLLIDTAGIRRKGKVREKLEKFSVIRALAALERAEMALVLLDAEEGITEQDTKIIGYALERDRACLILINKWDLVASDPKRQKWVHSEVERLTRFIGYAPTLTISALTGKGVGKVFPVLETIHAQYRQEFTTGRLNRVLQEAVEGHSPSLHRGRRIKFYYVTQVASAPPTFVLFVNYPEGVHFSYHRYLVNQFRTALGLDKIPIKLLYRERKRKKYE